MGILTNFIKSYKENIFQKSIALFLEDIEDFAECYDLICWPEEYDEYDKVYHIDFSIKFAESSPQKWYDNLIDIFELSKECSYKHKVKNIQELNAIFYKMLYILRDKEMIDMSWLDTSEVSSLITKDDKEITLNDLNASNVNDIAFIKFNNIKWCDHPIIMYKDMLCFPDSMLRFGNPNECTGLTKKEAAHSFDGYDNTYAKEDDIENFPAFKYCVNESKYGYKGYLPAAGEADFLYTIIPFLNFILDKINMNRICFFDFNLWTSTMSNETEKNNKYAYILSNGCISSELESVECVEKHYVIPLFAKSGNHCIN